MKTDKYTEWTFFLAALFLFLVAMCGPFVISSGTYLSAYRMLFFYGFDWMLLVELLPFVFTIASGVLIVFRNKNKAFAAIVLLLSLVSGVLYLFLPAFHSYRIGGDESDNILGFFSVLMAMVSFALALGFNGKAMEDNAFSVKDMVEISMLVALACILDFRIFKISFNANGGSISFAMLPLMIIALRHGPVKGFIATGIVYGFVNCAIDGYGFVYFPFDYFLGFGSIAVMGFFRNQVFPMGESKLTWKGFLFLAVGVVMAFVLRSLSATISGMLFYGLNFWDSLIYQMTYIPASFGACLVALCILYKPLLMVNRRYPANRSYAN